MLGEPTNLTVDKLYFLTFFTYIKNNSSKHAEKIKKRDSKYLRMINDDDIITQTYYSFKSITDKWVNDYLKDDYGYPFKNDRSKGLISQFAFVDRAMNP